MSRPEPSGAAAFQRTDRFHDALLMQKKEGGALHRRGAVEAVFQRAATLLDPSRRERITVLDKKRDLVPLSLAVDLGALALEKDARWILQGPILWIERRIERRCRGCEGVWSLVKLEGAGRSLSVCSIPMNASDQAASARTIEASIGLLETRAKEHRTEAALGPRLMEGSLAERTRTRLEQALSDLLTALASPVEAASTDTGSFQEDGILRAVRGLYGLGAGLTPSGDDLLVGVTAAAFVLHGHGLLAPGVLQALQSRIDGLDPSATHAVSRQMLDHAIRGEIPEPLLIFLELLCSQDPSVEELNGAAESLRRVGAGSGSEMLYGAVQMLRAALRLATSPLSRWP